MAQTPVLKPSKGISSALATTPTSPPSPEPAGPPCRADLDCDPTNVNNELIRCSVSSQSPAPTPEGNCHPAGPTAVGNATCICTKVSAPVTPLPTNASSIQYLMIGDSISQGVQPDLEDLLQANVGWELSHNPGNAASSNLGAHVLDSYLNIDQIDWDVISYQYGLHDLAYDVERLTATQYEVLLTNITTRLAQVQASSHKKLPLLWVQTTPVPTVPTYTGTTGACNDTSKCLNPPRFDSDVALFNSIATKVIQAANQNGANIQVLDLYSFVLAKCGGHGYVTCDGFQLPQNVHYTATGWTALANQYYNALMNLKV